jgi:hypothetical protein
MGPILLFDKSAVEALSVDESTWLDNFFINNITPMLYIETLADLEKNDRGRGSPEKLVSEIAFKTPTQHVGANFYHGTLVEASLMGEDVPMSGRPVVNGGKPKRSPDGQIGYHVDSIPEVEALQRWQSEEFTDLERLYAKDWRKELSSMDFDTTIDLVKNILPAGTRLKSLAEIKTFVDGFVKNKGKEFLYLELKLLEVPDKAYSNLLKKYQEAGEPPLDEFAPYATYVFKVDLVFYLAMHFGLISKDRPSHRIDLAYLYYLPFCQAFVSSDKLHAQLVPLFLDNEQEFVPGTDLKAAFKELDEHYSQFQDEIEKQGIMRYAAYPPRDMENSVTKLWDKFCPPWREHDQERKEGSDPVPLGKTDKEFITEMNKKHDEAVDVELPADGSKPDYIVITRVSPIRRGKWRILPPEVEKS